jgi:cation diffusion facilitator family transporter
MHQINAIYLRRDCRSRIDMTMPWLMRHVPRPEAIAATLSVVVGATLLIVKFIAYAITGSTAIFSDALESIVNVLASVFALYSLILAHRPADKDHPYGHGKAEFLAVGFEGGMILLAALAIAARAIESLLRQTDIERVAVGLIMMAGAMLVNGGLGTYLARRGRKTGSMVLEADGKHLLTDAYTSVAVIGALLVVKWTGWTWFDPVAAIGVAVYISIVGARLLSRSAAGLMDQQDNDDDRLLRQILDSHLGPAGKEPRICSYHKLRHRHSGRYHWVDFHIMVPAEWDVRRGHNCASDIEYEIEQALGEGNATAHVEPCVDAACATCMNQPARPV